MDVDVDATAPLPAALTIFHANRQSYLSDSASSSASSGTGTMPTTEPTPSPVSDILASPSSLFLAPASPQTQSPLMRSPSEILHRVLMSSGAEDLPALARAAKTCRELRSFIYENPDQALWRDIHLQRYDDPRAAGAFVKPRDGFHWKRRVQDRQFVGRVFREWTEERYDELSVHFDLICSTLMDMYLDLPPTVPPTVPPTTSNPTDSTDPTDPTDPADSRPPVADESLNGDLLDAILHSETFAHMYYSLSTRETKPQLRPLRGQPGNPNRRGHREAVNPDLCRLHVLLAPDFDPTDLEQRAFRGYLREVVYSAMNFTERNDWGPFHPDGTVDWVLVDAIGTIMMANAKEVIAMGEDSWRNAVYPMSYGLDPVRGWGFNDLRPPGKGDKRGVWDWAGVGGTWCGSYAFLDYADWISLNEPRLVMIRRSMNQLDLSRYSEAIGDLMSLQLVVDGETDPSLPAHAQQRINADLPPVTTHLPTSDLLPPIHFHGSSVQASGAMTYPAASSASFVRGVVRLTADDPPQVRWTLVIRYGGEDRWRLEGVQVGGRGAKRGFFGIWTDAAKEEHSPNGPVWYWPAP